MPPRSKSTRRAGPAAPPPAPAELGLTTPPSAATRPDVTINVTINDTKELTDAERTIAGLLRKSPTATRADLSAKSGLSSRQIQRILDSLKSKLGLRRVGSRKTGRWAFSSA